MINADPSNYLARLAALKPGDTVLVEDGKVQLTDPVSKFLPSFKNPMVSVGSYDPVFGGIAYMLDGRMCCGVLNDELVARVGSDDYAAALRQPHVRPMDFTGRPMKGYVFVHPEGYETEKQLRHWLDLALAFNPRAKASKKRVKAE